MRKGMMEGLQRRLPRSRGRAGLLAALRDNRAGNVLAMMAIALIPLLFIAGSAVDTARLYMVKTRLQQACDAGTLAGRRFMVSTNEATLDTGAVTQANAFFANNFKLGLFGTKAVTFAPSKTSDNQVAGTATATVPMTLTGMMGFRDQVLSVTCEARYDVADTDIMFVLDTTGSMACTTADGTGGCSQPVYSYTRPAPDGTTGYAVTEKSGSKISGLRQAVLNFYDTLAAAVDPATHLRYGFVPYTSTVNAGAAVTALSPGYIVDSWTYNSRRPAGDANNGSGTSNWDYSKNKTQCTATYNRQPATGFTTAGSATLTYGTWNTNYNACVITVQPLRPKWTYEKVTFDTSHYKLFNAVPDLTKVTGATSRWQGCLEERSSTATGTFDYANLPPDLDPDLVPTTPETRWKPMWPDVVYFRGGYSSLTYSGDSSNPYGDGTSTGTLDYFTALNAYQNIAYGWVSCGKPVQRLKVMTRAEVSNYVNAPDFVPQGGTYHDTGMIWGTRLLSPTGLFAADTAAWPGRTPPKRYIVFMTDGDMAPNMCLYGMYGIENYDQRVTNVGFQSSCSSTTQLNNHYARFLAACAAAKAHNISIFVVGFGQTLTSQLTQCATPGQAFYAADNAALNAAFQTIAKRVAMLRVSK